VVLDDTVVTKAGVLQLKTLKELKVLNRRGIRSEAARTPSRWRPRLRVER
jgi:hypothetical protein